MPESSEERIDVIIMGWSEYRHGQMLRDMGYTVHLTTASCRQQVQDFWLGMLPAVDSTITRPSGEIWMARPPISIKEELLISELKGEALWKTETNVQWICDALSLRQMVDIYDE